MCHKISFRYEIRAFIVCYVFFFCHFKVLIKIHEYTNLKFLIQYHAISGIFLRCKMIPSSVVYD